MKRSTPMKPGKGFARPTAAKVTAARGPSPKKLKPFNPKPRRCKACPDLFTPRVKLQVVCGPRCAEVFAKLQRAKAERKADAATRLKLKPRGQWLREAQAVFNAFIRLRDAGLPCISCGRHHDGQWHAGHYLSTGARPELRFTETNVHKQCQPCNAHMHGNLVLYRVGLILKVGLAEVERLEGPHEPLRLAAVDLQTLKATYAAKARELKKGAR